MENPACDSSFPFADPLPPALRRCLTHFKTSLRAERFTWFASEVLSRILGVSRVGLQTRRSSSSSSSAAGGGGAGGLVVGRVVTRGRIRGEWTTPCYQLGASRLPRADKLLHPHQRHSGPPNQADLSQPGNTALLVSLPCPISLVALGAAGGTKVKV